jgi:alpha/beta superfamily hydrolase
MLIDKLNTPGEHLFSFTAEMGALEITLLVPEKPNPHYIALLGHPHSLEGGTMNNKVVTTLARAFKELQIPSLRFNFRGVGKSAGAYDAGIGESKDMLALAIECLKEQPTIKFIFAGFSFGSYVAYRAAAQSEHALLITIAPPVPRFDYTEFAPPSPWVIIQGDDDDVVSLNSVLDFAKQFSPPLPVLRFAETGHFFHGKLIELKASLIETIKTYVIDL